MSSEPSVDHPHRLFLFHSDNELAAGVGELLSQWLCSGETVLALFTSTHLHAIERHLRERGVDFDSAVSEGRFVTIEAQEAMDDLLRSGRVEPDEFAALSSGPVARIIESGRTCHVIGEVVGLLWAAGEVQAAMDLEDRWLSVCRDLGFTLDCTYPVPSIDAVEHDGCVDQLFRIHTEVIRPSATQEFRAEFLPDPVAARNARQLVAQALDGEDERFVSKVVLVASELAANVVRHAPSEFSVRIQIDERWVRIFVTDQRPLARTDEHGGANFVVRARHGLDIVSKLATGWGIVREQTGKTVWAEVAR